MIESMNARLRKVTRNCGQFPSGRPLSRCFTWRSATCTTITARTITARTRHPEFGMERALEAFTIYFDGRIPTP